MTPLDASKNHEELRYSFSFKNIKPKLKDGDYVRNADNRNIFCKRFTSNWNTELLKSNQVLKTQPSNYRIDDFDSKILEGKKYEEELPKSDFYFEPDNVLESLNIDFLSYASKKCKENKK